MTISLDDLIDIFLRIQPPSTVNQPGNFRNVAAEESREKPSR